MPRSIEFDVFFDFLCPYVNAAALWLRDVQRQSPDQITIRWRYFPLEQVNSREGPDWKLWEQPDSHESRGLLAFRAAAAARQQGDEAFTRMLYAVLAAKHEAQQDIAQPDVLIEAARASELDLARFERDFQDRTLLAEIGADYTEGRQLHDVFGTPTFVFPEGAAAYLKVLPPPPVDAALEFFDQFMTFVRDRPFVHEVKRPRRT